MLTKQIIKNFLKIKSINSEYFNLLFSIHEQSNILYCTENTFIVSLNKNIHYISLIDLQINYVLKNELERLKLNYSFGIYIQIGKINKQKLGIILLFQDKDFKLLEQNQFNNISCMYILVQYSKNIIQNEQILEN